jgi:hypothetical protein
MMPRVNGHVLPVLHVGPSHFHVLLIDEPIARRFLMLVFAPGACPREPVADDLAARPRIKIAFDPVIVDVCAFGA